MAKENEQGNRFNPFTLYENDKPLSEQHKEYRCQLIDFIEFIMKDAKLASL